MPEAAEFAYEFRLLPPQRQGQRILFRWEESQPTGLFEKTSFHLEFPNDIEVGRIPEAVWWSAFLLCMHVQWSLLGSCLVRLPIALAPGQREVLLRLMDTYCDTLDALCPDARPVRRLEILEEGATLDAGTSPAGLNGMAIAYSGGKDSLVTVGLAIGMGYVPWLVTVNSPMPGLHYDVSSHRNRAMDLIGKRTGLLLIEVKSDMRGVWNNFHPREMGYPLSMNELTDTMLYTAALFVVGHHFGAGQLLLASENELATMVCREGRLLQHSHFMYSALTQYGIGLFLSPFGIRHGSLTSSLRSNQVQQLLTRDFRRLRDIQTSCWRLSPERRACSECGECRRLAWVCMAHGGDPADQGIDLVHMLNNYVIAPPNEANGSRHEPNRLASNGFRMQFVDAIAGIAPPKVLLHILRHHPMSLMNGKGWKAYRRFRELHTMHMSQLEGKPTETGFRARYLELLEPGLRSRLFKFLRSRFDEEPVDRYAESHGCLLEGMRRLESSTMI